MTKKKTKGFEPRNLISDAAKVERKRLAAKEIRTPNAWYELYVPAKHTPTLPRRPGSADAFLLPSLIAGQRVVPKAGL